MSTLTSSAARGTLLSIALRLISFLLSQLILRTVSTEALGSASVPLELLLSTSLFFSREGFRLALTKEIGNDDDDRKDTDGEQRKERHEGVEEKTNTHVQENTRQIIAQRHQQQVTNVSWLSVPIGTILSVLALWMHLKKCNRKRTFESEHALLDYKLAGILYCLASFVEILSEPLVIRCQQQMDVATKAKAEGAALVMKSASCFGCLYFTGCGEVGRCYPVTAFGISQLAYAIVFTSILFSKGGIHWPRTMAFPSKGNARMHHATIRESSSSIITHTFDLHSLYLVFLFTLQGLFKHALTEADKIVLSVLAEAYDQGVYAIATSYGGLAARMLLQPMEENARLLFSRQGSLLVAQQQHTDNRHAASNNHAKDFEDTYYFLVRVVVHIGFLFAAIATNYTSVLLRVLAGSQWGSNAEASNALSAFCVYTAFLALNGTTEAFVYGVSRTGHDVAKISFVHAVAGGVFALVAPELVRKYGAVGLVVANCVAMALRSMYSLYFSHCYFLHGQKKQHTIAGTLIRMMPHWMVIGAFSASFGITRASRDYIYYAEIAADRSWIIAGMQHIGVGILCVGATAALSLWLERDIQLSLATLIKRKKD